MNKKIEELIAKRINEINEEKLARRKRHLIDLGLTDGQDRQYIEHWTNSPNCKYDEEKEMYYIGSDLPMEVSDEEYAEICKYYPEEYDLADGKLDLSAENTLKTISALILFFGVIILFAGIVLVVSEETPFISILGAIVFFILILCSWAILKCVANISVTLKEIKAKIK